jgi:ubiquinone/menaquinone biosynthesis C-methylase UbiE
VDLVSEMLARGTPRWQQHARHVMPVQGDSERLPFASGSFDIVTCAHSFHHYPRQDRAVVEMHRVLRTGGRLMLIDGYRDAPWGYFIYEVCVAAREGAVHHAKKARLRELFAQAGLRAVAQTVFRGPAPFMLTEGVAAETLTAINPPHFLTLGAAARAHDSTA